MKIFTVEEANELLPMVRVWVFEIQQKHLEFLKYRESARKAAQYAELGGGGIVGGSIYLQLLFGINELTKKLDELGVQLKDYSLGLIDFPCLINGKVVLLCWKLGEGDKIEWWHEIETGFAGRKPL